MSDLNPATGQRLFIQRTQLAQAQLGPDPDAPAQRPLQAGEARLAVQRFSLTANNITYAAFGEAMRYWDFFPSGDAALGCLPVWGFATVAESQVDGLAVGRRVWGYYPAGTHLVVAPSKVSAHGFTDGAAHRRELALVYNQYQFCDADPGYRADLEDLQAVLRPLFMTSFLIDDFLDVNGFFGATQVLLSSASSKTAVGTAHCLALRRGRPGAPRIVGLTSPGNVAYCRSLGCYDAVLTYDALPSLDAATPTVYVDFSGDAPLRRAIHGHFAAADALRHSCSVGGTHWQALGAARDLPGPKPVLFFAPAQVKLRSGPPPEGWGPAELQRRMGEAWVGFLAQVAAGDWVQIDARLGAPAALQAYGQVLGGQVDARQGVVVALA
ncbi:DUF2855 family protein [Ideonella sp. DXS22W]|uniref:DUF2855 family protein n=1 Tax=Pseudaquabacterium inlustre TaxID=2984192 RepID=A0ABU9CHW5_9BURK